MENLMELKYKYPHFYQEIRYKLLNNPKMREFINNTPLEKLFNWASMCDNGEDFYQVINWKMGETVEALAIFPDGKTIRLNGIVDMKVTPIVDK